MKKAIKFVAILTPVLFPIFAFAQNSLLNLLGELDMVVTLAITVVTGLALLAFFWGLVKFILAQGNETAKTEAKKVMGWGIVALFVMVSVWGLVRFMQNALLGGTDLGPPPLPSSNLPVPLYTGPQL